MQDVEHAIEQARQVIVVLPPNTINSPWVRKEIQKALHVEQRRKDEGYRVVPLLLPGVEPSALSLWFDEEPIAVPIQLTPGGLSEALPRLPADFQPLQAVASRPVEELLLKLSDPNIQTHEGKRCATATATLVYDPANPAVRGVESKRYVFTAPLGPIEAEDLCWYLESYYFWPTGVFKERASRIKAMLPQWGQELYKAGLAAQVAQEALTAWQQAPEGVDRHFAVLVHSDLPEGASLPEQAGAKESRQHFAIPTLGAPARWSQLSISGQASCANLATISETPMGS